MNLRFVVQIPTQAVEDMATILHGDEELNGPLSAAVLQEMLGTVFSEYLDEPVQVSVQPIPTTASSGTH